MRKMVFLATLAAVALAGPASARLVTFDLIKGTGEEPIPTGWASFDWSANFDWLNSSAEGDTGYQYGTVSPPNVAYNAYGANVSFRRNTPFELVSFDLTGAWNNGLEVTVTGFRKGVQVDSTTFTVNSTGPTLETLNWDVNRVTFVSFGGTPAGYPNGSGEQFVLDNLTTMPITQPSTDFNSFSAVPEASTWALMLVGFAGLGCAGFRKARGSASRSTSPERHGRGRNWRTPARRGLYSNWAGAELRAEGRAKPQNRAPRTRDAPRRLRRAAGACRY